MSEGPSGENAGRLTQALLYEASQAWDHYRHVENQRNQYVAFSFTVALASLGLVASIAASADTPSVAVTVSAATATFTGALALVTYWSIQRFRHILAFYNKLIRTIRRELFKGSERESLWINELEIYKILPSAVSGRLLGPQAIAELSLLVLMSISLAVAPASLASFAWWSYNPVQYVIILTSGGISLFLATAAVVHGRRVAMISSRIRTADIVSGRLPVQAESES